MEEEVDETSFVVVVTVVLVGRGSSSLSENEDDDGHDGSDSELWSELEDCELPWES